MQVEIKQEHKVFKPVTLEIIFETENELIMFESMLSWDVSIPEVVYEEDEEKQADLAKMLGALRKKLYKLSEDIKSGGSRI